MKYFGLLLVVGFLFIESSGRSGVYEEVNLSLEQTQKRILKRIIPDVPAKIREFHAIGTLRLIVQVDETGRVIKAKVIKAKVINPFGLKSGLSDFLEGAVNEWEFERLEVKGKALPFRGRIDVIFWYGSFPEKAPW